MDLMLLFIFCIFGVVSLMAFWVLRLLSSSDAGKVHQRLIGKALAPRQPRTRVRLRELVQKIGQSAAKPFMPSDRQKQSAMRRKLNMAGIYTPSAIRTMTGCKVIFLGIGLLSGYVCGAALHNPILPTTIGGLVGYLLPMLWVNHRIKRQQQALEYGLPDALDLMVVCVEAGLAVDAAMQRVGQELALAHPELSRELEIAHMETRVGLSRAESLKNLGVRTGSVALQGLSSMLVQADRFGTSIATALRVHGESLRVSRQHKAEEMAAKASVKMSFPLVLFIFPATFIVLAGPTVIGLMRSSLFN